MPKIGPDPDFFSRLIADGSQLRAFGGTNLVQFVAADFAVEGGSFDAEDAEAVLGLQMPRLPRAAETSAWLEEATK